MNRMNGLVLLLIAVLAVPVSSALSQEEVGEGSAGAVAPESRPPIPAPLYLNSDPRRTAEAYMKAVVEGRVDDAVALLRPNSNAGREEIEGIGKLLGGKMPVIETVLVSEEANEALALFLLPRLKQTLPGWSNEERMLLILDRIRGGWGISGTEIGNKFVANELHGVQSSWPETTLKQTPEGWRLSHGRSAALSHLPFGAPPRVNVRTPPPPVLPPTVGIDAATAEDLRRVVFTDPAAAAEAYLKAALEGRTDDAVALAESSSSASLPGNIEKLRGEVVGERPVLESVYVSEKEHAAIAVTSRLSLKGTQPEGRKRGRLLLTLARMEGAWLIKGVDIETDETAVQEIKKFEEQYADAMKVEWSKAESRSTEPDSTAVTVVYRFLKGDEIDFECGADSELDRKLIVQPDGMITLRLLGQVKAAGLTVAELREQVEEAYKEYYHTPGITVTPSSFGLHDKKGPAAETTKALPGPRYIAAGDLMVSWSENGDAVWGFSKRLGIWKKQVIDPAAKEPLMPIAGSNVACVQVGRRFYGYSSEKGWWNVLELPPDMDLAEAVPVVEKDLVLLTGGDSIYTYASSTGRWSSRDGGIAESAEKVLDAPPSMPGNIVGLRADYSQFEEEAAGLIKMLNDHPDRSQVTDVDPEFRANLTKVVRNAFEARQELQRAELVAFRLRLDALQKKIDDRERMQDEIVKRRVAELLNPNLKWESTVDEPEAGGSAERAGANERMPAVPSVNSPQFGVDAYFCPTLVWQTRTDVAKAGESVALVLDVANLERRSLTGLTVSVQLDESLKLQTASKGYEREGNQLTWQNQSVEANRLGRYAVECLCLQPMPSIKCRVTVTDSGGQQQSREVSLRIDSGEASLPAEGEATDNEQTVVPEQEANDGPSQ
jgi:polysaccharide biosynthesis/export protein